MFLENFGTPTPRDLDLLPKTLVSQTKLKRNNGEKKVKSTLIRVENPLFIYKTISKPDDGVE